jgi:hypothetical protein
MCFYLDSCVRFSEIRPDKPFRSGKCVKKKLFCGVVLINRLPIVLPHELEQSRPLVLPDGRLVVAVDYDLVARSRATHGGQQCIRLRIAHRVQLGAVLVAHVTLRIAQIPFQTRRLCADVGALLDGDVVPDARHLALRGGRVSDTAD